MNKRVIVQSSNQINAQHQTSSPIPIPLCQYPKDFQVSNHVFNHDALSRQLPICLSLLFAQLAAFRLFGWCLRVLVFLFQTLITGIAQAFNRLAQTQSALFEQFKIVCFAFCLARANDLSRFLVNDHLRFYRVPLTLARIVSALFFFGRSMTVSVASTTIISNKFSLSCKTFLPGNLKSGHFFKISSILRIIRHTVGSLKFHELAMWNCVRYSRQYSKVNKTWSSILKRVGLPGFFCPRLSSSPINWQMWRNVSGLSPQCRLNFSGDRCFIFS